MKFLKPCGHVEDQDCRCETGPLLINPLPLNHPAVRAFVTALSRSARLREQEEGWQCDRHFDGGEWSDGFHAEAYAQVEWKIAEQVASRFGMSAHALWDQAMIAGEDFQYRWQNAMTNRRIS